MPKYDYRLICRDTLASLEASVKQKVKEGYELVDREDGGDMTLTEALRSITDPTVRLRFGFQVSMRKELTEDEIRRNRQEVGIVQGLDQEKAKDTPLGEFDVSEGG